MKTRKLQFKQLLKLYLLKYKACEPVFKNDISNLVTDLALDQILVNFKQILQIIFQYHIQNKRILFIGTPKKIELKINNMTNHVAISRHFYIQGFISNISNVTSLNIKQEKKQKLFTLGYLLPKLAKKPDLIVWITCDKKKEDILKECHDARLPVLIFETNNKIPNTNLFFVSLNFIFKTYKINHKKP